ncbi:MAG: hypothetical protein RR527_04740 [Clostridia bacterium]
MPNELDRIIERHKQRYPAMQPQDLVKLIYQNELGGGHMITDGCAALSQLIEECSDLAPEYGEQFEDIGNGHMRLHLRPALASGVAMTTLCTMFMASAVRQRGSMKALVRKLNTLPESSYVKSYINDGCNMVSHSKKYSEAYKPAYRVVDSAYSIIFQLLCRIDTLLCVKPTVTVVIDGHSAAGKSSLGSLLAGLYPCRLMHMDDFFLPMAKRTAARLSQPGGNVDYERFKNEVVDNLSSSIAYRRYDCEKDVMKRIVMKPTRILNVIEGAYSMHPYFGDYCDVAVFMDVDAGKQRARILARNGERMQQRYIDEWIPMEHTYLDTFNIASKCDFEYKFSLYI